MPERCLAARENQHAGTTASLTLTVLLCALTANIHCHSTVDTACVINVDGSSLLRHLQLHNRPRRS